MKLEPFYSRVVVKIEPNDLAKQAAKAGIMLPPDREQEYNEATVVGEVVAVGASSGKGIPGQTDFDIGVGWRVLFKKYAGVDATNCFDPDGNKYRVIQDTDIIGKID